MNELPRTKQMAQKSVGGCLLSEMLDKTNICHFKDHSCKRALRVRCWSTTKSLDEDFHKEPVFSIQVYSTIPLDLETAEGTHRGKNKTEDFIRYIAGHKHIGNEAQRPEPVYEIYSEQPNVSACVEHQRLEIAHRHAHKGEADNVLIPRMVLDVFKEQTTGFCVIVDSSSYTIFHLSRGLQEDAELISPILAYFDPSPPSKAELSQFAPLVDIPSGIGNDYTTIGHIEGFPERLDAHFTRARKTRDSDELVWKLIQSYCPGFEGIPAMDTEVGEIRRALGTDGIHQYTPLLNKDFTEDDYQIHLHSSRDITTWNHTDTEEPDLRYFISMPFLSRNRPSNATDFRQAAKDFTSSIMTRLPSGKKFSFDFCIPASPTIKSILISHRFHTAVKPDDYIGALFDTDQYPSFRYQKNRDPSFRLSGHRASTLPSTLVRVHPNNLLKAPNKNMPFCMGVEPYRTFIIIVDQADFPDSPGAVRFLLADGNNRCQCHEDQSIHKPWQSHKEVMILRTVNLDLVARRLAMATPDTIESTDYHIVTDEEVAESANAILAQTEAQ